MLKFLLIGGVMAAGSVNEPCWKRMDGRQSNVKVASDISYQRGRSSQKLDIYTPVGIQPPFKTVIMIHGGCFQWGSKDSEDNLFQIRRLTSAGFAVVAPSYRLVEPGQKESKNAFPAPLEDVQDAVRWVRENGSKHQLETDKLMAFGTSAGATLSSYLGTRPVEGSDHRKDKKEKLDPVLSKRVNGVVDLFGRTDLTKPYPNEPKDRFGRDCGEELMGESRTPQEMEDFENASVLKGVTQESSDFLIIHGTGDKTVNPEHSELLYKKLVETVKEKPAIIKHRFRWRALKNADHGFSDLNDMNSAWDEICGFLTDRLGKPEPLRTPATKTPAAKH